MRRIPEPHWIRHARLFDPDEYECSNCHRMFTEKYSACPNCESSLKI